MIESPVPFLAVVLLLAGIPPAVAAWRPMRLFRVLPPIVLSYLAATLLAGLGGWRATAEIREVQTRILGDGLPALVFVLLVGCDLRALVRLGPRMLAAFGCATGSILAGIVLAWLAWRPLLPSDGWRVMAATGAGWVGGAANLMAVSHAIAASPETVSVALVTDTVCYTAWVFVLFTVVPLAAAFNRWSGGIPPALPPPVESPAAPVSPGAVLSWLGAGLVAAQASALAAGWLPQGGVLTATSWTLLSATALGTTLAFSPLARLPGREPTASALLAVLVVTMGSRCSLAGLGEAPRFILAGMTALAVHAGLMILAAKLLRLDMATCGIASLANIGGVASAPLYAAVQSPAMAPAGVVLALAGYLLGTASGLGLAALLESLAG
jgi:uncharacterized membrane protein